MTSKGKSFVGWIFGETKEWARENITNHHAHHNVMKDAGNLSPAAQNAVAASQKVLDDVGINPFFGRENLVWAPSWKHSNAYAIEVNLRLQKAYKDGLKIV